MYLGNVKLTYGEWKDSLQKQFAHAYGDRARLDFDTEFRGEVKPAYGHVILDEKGTLVAYTGHTVKPAQAANTGTNQTVTHYFEMGTPNGASRGKATVRVTKFTPNATGAHSDPQPTYTLSLNVYQDDPADAALAGKVIAGWLGLEFTNATAEREDALAEF